MTGPEHYLTAEKLLAAARSPKGRAEEEFATLQAAQVHATLALAAATALYDADLALGDDVEAHAWKQIAGSETAR